MCRAAGWERLGRTKGYARANGRYTDPHGKPKEIPVRALRRDARALLPGPRPLPPDVAPPAARRAGRGPRLPPGPGHEAHGGLRTRRARARGARQHEGLPGRRAVRGTAVAGGA